MKVSFFGGPTDGHEMEIPKILSEYRLPVPTRFLWKITKDWHYEPIRCLHYEAGRDKETGEWKYWFAGEW